MSTSSLKLDGKIALVTGGTSGIGLATAQRFVAEGAHVFVTGRRQAELDAAVKAIGRNVTGVRGDVSKLDDLDRLYDTIRAQKGRLDVLFANAGGGSLGAAGPDHRGTLRQDLRHQRARPAVHRAEGAAADGRGRSSIVLNASITSIKGTPAFSVYSATKAAVRSFARSWAVDLKDAGIRVNAVSPGVVPTPAYELLGLTPEQVEGFIESQAQAIPLGRVGTPDEIAKAAVFLASDDSSFVNATELFVDGGMAQI